ncbi:MAG: RNA polymerase sigma factor [Phycisphaerae bacterium]|nr:RNA polymerase sigma factor [Tepidisphaeraceae bacterium]
MKATLDPILPRSEQPDDVCGGPTGELLSAFVSRRDESAFAALVQRHGAMVLGVCRRVTGNAHDADDAFQATFLVLARKAHTVSPPGRLGPWLFGVAYRTALKARAVAARHREGERRFAQMNPDRVDDSPQQWADLRTVLDEEIHRLPDRYRAAVVACDLEGKSRHAAATDLAVNEGTLSSRLSRGRELLAARLSRRGVALPAAVLVGLLSSHAATAAPAAALVAKTATAAVSFATGGTLAAGIVSAKAAVLSEGVLHAMFIAKAKIVASLCVAAVLTGTGVAVVTQIALAGKGDKPAKVAEGPGGKGGKADYVRPDLSGTVTQISADGKQVTLQSGKGGKGEPAAGGTFEVTATTDVTFSSIALNGDVPAAGYQAQVWLEPNSKDKAARVSYSGVQSSKEARPAGASGKITAVSPDGKRLTIASRPQADKGAKVDKAEKPAEPEPIEVAITPATQVTFSAVGPDGATLREGYEAQVYLDPAVPGNAAAVRVTGSEAGAMKSAMKDLGEGGLMGNVVSVATDGKSVTIEGRMVPVQPKVEKGAAPAEKPAKGEAAAPAGKAGAKVEVPPQRIDVALTADTKVTYNGVAAGGAAPTVGYGARVWLDGPAAKAIQFDAIAGKEKKGADISSAVVAVAAGGKKITVTLPPKGEKVEKGEKGAKLDKAEPAEEREIDLSDAKIVFNNVRAGQAVPTAGYYAQIWVDPQAPGMATMVVFSPGKGKN